MPKYTYRDTVPNLAEVAGKIVNDSMLRHFLLANDIKHRKAIYEALKPYLSFRPKPYFLLHA